MTLQAQLRAGTPVMVQGATGHAARRHMALMRQHGTHIVAGVSPGRDGETVDGVTIYSTCAAAVAARISFLTYSYSWQPESCSSLTLRCLYKSARCDGRACVVVS